MNFDKCKAVVFGGLTTTTTTNFTLAQSFNSKFLPNIQLDAIDLGIKILGIWFFSLQHITYTENYKKLEEKIRKKLNFLRLRKLSIKGKALAVNTLVLSKIWYVASAIPYCSANKNALFQNQDVPNFVQNFNNLIYFFIWGHNSNPIKRNILQMPVNRGGIGILNVEIQSLALRTKQINQILKVSCKLPSTKLARYWLAESLQSMSGHANFLSRYVVTTGERPYPLLDYRSNRGYDSLITLIQCNSTVKRKFQNLSNPPSCKSIYQALFAAENKDIAADQKWRRLGFPMPHWENSWLALNSNRQQENLWKLRHYILHFEDTINSMSGNQNNSIGLPCLTCNAQRNTHVHIFLECAQAVRTWQLLEPVIAKIDPARSIVTQKEWILGLPGTNKRATIFNTFVTAAINAIWIAWCENRHNQNVSPPQVIARKTIQSFKNSIKTQFQIAKKNENLDSQNLQINEVCAITCSELIFMI